ncbi:Zinc finger C2H2-type [Trinorchestia longiramus]|nr:Zinc finger C2H2-type [Trinorchestia longiramus]
MDRALAMGHKPTDAEVKRLHCRPDFIKQEVGADNMEHETEDTKHGRWHHPAETSTDVWWSHPELHARLYSSGLSPVDASNSENSSEAMTIKEEELVDSELERVKVKEELIKCNQEPQVSLEVDSSTFTFKREVDEVCGEKCSAHAESKDKLRKSSYDSCNTSTSHPRSAGASLGCADFLKLDLSDANSDVEVAKKEEMQGQLVIDDSDFNAECNGEYWTVQGRWKNDQPVTLHNRVGCYERTLTGSKKEEFEKEIDRWITEGILLPWEETVAAGILAMMAVEQPTKNKEDMPNMKRAEWMLKKFNAEINKLCDEHILSDDFATSPVKGETQFIKGLLSAQDIVETIYIKTEHSKSPDGSMCLKNEPSETHEAYQKEAVESCNSNNSLDKRNKSNWISEENCMASPISERNLASRLLDHREFKTHCETPHSSTLFSCDESYSDSSVTLVEPCQDSSEKLVLSNQLQKQKTQEKASLYQCDICDYSTPYMTSFKRHQISKHSLGEPFRCELCDYSNASMSNLKQHQIAKHKLGKPYVCQLCNYSAATRHCLKRHEISKHSLGEPFRCQFCNYSNAKVSNLKQHQISKHNIGEPLRCQLCDFSTIKHVTLKQHLITKHSVGEPFKCELCDYSTAIRRRLYEHQVSKHNLGEPLKCELCEYCTANKNSMKEHRVNKHGLGVPLRCHLCSYSTAKRSNLRQHQASRHKIGQCFKCNFCRFSTAKNNRLKDHLRLKHCIEDVSHWELYSKTVI